MFESFLFNTLLGCLLGSVAGLIPGAGITITLMIAYPYLLGLDLLPLLGFYIGIANLAQFTGSITAIYFGMPGEANSIPAVHEGYALNKQGKAHQAIVGTSLGSTLAGVIALILLCVISPWFLDFFNLFYNIAFQMSLFTFVVIVFMFVGRNPWWVNVLVMLAGYFIGKVGYNIYTAEYQYTFNIVDLKNGIPFYPLLLGLLVVPHIFAWEDKQILSKQIIKNLDAVKIWFKNIKHSLLGTLIGLMCGLVPGMGTVLATNLAHKLSKGKTKGASYPALVSAESANNSAVLTTLLPLVVIGVPITMSEALLVNIMERSLLEVNWSILIESGKPLWLLISVIMSLTIGLIVSWPLSRTVQTLLIKFGNYLPYLVIVILLGTLVYVGNMNYALWFYILVFVIASIIGIVCRKLDMLPLVFLFLISDRLDFIGTAFYRLYL